MPSARPRPSKKLMVQTPKSSKPKARAPKPVTKRPVPMPKVRRGGPPMPRRFIMTDLEWEKTPETTKNKLRRDFAAWEKSTRVKT